MYGFSQVKNHRFIAVENLENTVFQAARLLLCHCHLVFKIFFTTSTTLWERLLQKSSF